MAKAILTSKPDSGYDDIREMRYHFPRTYLRQVEAAVGDQFIYYEPRRPSEDLSVSGGRQAYFATGRISHIEQDPSDSNRFYAFIDEYIDFDHAIPFQDSDHFYESALRKADGSVNKGAFGRAVRTIPEEEFSLLLRAGFTDLPSDENNEGRANQGLGEAQAPFDRPIFEQILNRPWRDRKFASRIRNAYDDTCAVTGLKIINGGGRAEIEAAHIRPVGDDHGGDDSVRNGLALCRTAHWMFDRGLISIGDDFSILVADKLLPEPAQALLRPDRLASVPTDKILRPARPYLEYHRDVIYKG